MIIIIFGADALYAVSLNIERIKIDSIFNVMIIIIIGSKEQLLVLRPP